jgi:hypothetical protein
MSRTGRSGCIDGCPARLGAAIVKPRCLAACRVWAGGLITARDHDGRPGQDRSANARGAAPAHAATSSQPRGGQDVPRALGESASRDRCEGAAWVPVFINPVHLTREWGGRCRSTDTKITATVPASASTGPITVGTAGGTGQSTAKFTVNPGISLSSTAGPPTSSVSVSGAGFQAFEGVDIALWPLRRLLWVAG